MAKGRRKANSDIYLLLDQHDLYIWQLADMVGLSESSVYRYLRKELPTDTKNEWIAKIQEAAHNAE